ncbi:hypothetical protein GPJ56_001623 [Histomonas meleagridis]|uniref:uncharacterized protein n=1 Tax=Histomonas meleagridis TaxID=135588 RepID=UPI003559F147|nr:hypothetical protein GPJ56_001623 [Histomonas meleagridis]KAH0807129.1 hypothetical protein GO595_000305 [Histomonas meleagridis]
MFLSDACVSRILHKTNPSNSISGMGLMDLNNAVLILFDKITRNCAPIVEMNEKEVILALPHFVPESMIDKMKAAGDTALSEFKAKGQPIGKTSDPEFPLDDLLSRMREKYHTVIIHGEATVYTAAVIEQCVSELLQIAAEHAGSGKAIGRNDVKWTIANNSDIAALFTD